MKPPIVKSKILDSKLFVTTCQGRNGEIMITLKTIHMQITGQNQCQGSMGGLQSQLFDCFTDTDDAVTVNISTC